eukprot:2143720-Rhodomonas_salina.1
MLLRHVSACAYVTSQYAPTSRHNMPLRCVTACSYVTPQYRKLTLRDSTTEKCRSGKPPYGMSVPHIA